MVTKTIHTLVPETVDVLSAITICSMSQFDFLAFINRAACTDKCLGDWTTGCTISLNTRYPLHALQRRESCYTSCFVNEALKTKRALWGMPCGKGPIARTVIFRVRVPVVVKDANPYQTGGGLEGSPRGLVHMGEWEFLVNQTKLNSLLYHIKRGV